MPVCATHWRAVKALMSERENRPVVSGAVENISVETRVSVTAPEVRNIPPWQCPGPGVGEVVSLPFALSAVYEFRCEAKLPNSDVDLCDECWAARLTAEIQLRNGNAHTALAGVVG